MSREHETYVTFVARWLRGSNSGEFQNLYITSRGRGTSLFMQRKRKGKPADLRLGQIVGNQFKLCTVNDPLGLVNLALAFGLEIEETSLTDYRLDGSIKR
jgi:hypothetical protein